jgi:hypothetical protein
MTEFKVGDKIKYDIKDSYFKWYGTVVNVTPKYVDVHSSDFEKSIRVAKKFVNFD